MSDDYIFKAFVVNSAEYDNGNKETSGAWLTFPTAKDEVSALFKEIGLPNNAESGQYFIDEYRCGNNDLLKILSVHSNIDELNYLANRISELEDIEMTVFQTVIQTKNCENIKDAINLTRNTECFDVVAGMGSWSNVGAYIAERDGLGIEVLGPLSNYIDYATYGRAYANDNGGYLIDDIYLEKNSAKFKEVYHGNIEDIPPEYLVTENGKNIYEDYIFDMQFEASKDLARDIDTYMHGVDREYASKYPNDLEQLKFFSDCLIAGNTLSLKDMLTATNTLQGDALVDRICEFEQKYPCEQIQADNQKESEEKNMSDKMKVLVVEPMREPYTKEIPTGLKSLQNEVGGLIQVIYPFAESIGLICNEEGKNKGLELNRALYDAENQMYDIVAGTFILAGLGDEDFTSLPPEHIKQMTERFKQPEIFIKVNGKIKAVHVKPSIKAAIDKLKKEQDGRDKPQPQKKPPNQEL